MAYYFSPIGNSQQLATSGAPLNAGTITTFLAGTTTPAATYTDNAGGNPSVSLTLNTYGLPSSPVWLLGGQAIKFVIKDSLGNTIRTVDNVSGVNDPSAIPAADQWVAFTGTLTYISATSFSVAGDQTNTFQVGRRVRSVNTGGTIYSTVATSTFSVVTTVVLINDSTTLDAGLSAVSYGFLTATNASIPTNSIAPMGECRLTKSGANLLLSPFNGNRLTVNGVAYKIPSAGVTLAPPATTLTLYYIYAFMTAGVMTLEASTTVHATDTTTGMEIKNGDATRTLVGMARTLTNAWVDSATQRFVVSYFNRRRIRLMQTSVSVSGFDTVDVERTTANRCEFLTWADEAFRFGTNGYVGNTATAGINNAASGSIDGATAVYQTCIHYSSGASSIGPLSWNMSATATEGYHYSSCNANTSSGSNGIVQAQNWAEVMG